MAAVIGGRKLAVDEATGLDGKVDQSRVGTDPDMAWLHAPMPPSRNLSPVQEHASQILAEVDVPERVDAMLGLDKGMVRRWSAESEAFREAVLRRRKAMKPRVEPPDYEAVLTPKQQRAAQLEAEGTSKTEIANRLELHRSTLYNWEKDSAYRGLVRRFVEDFAAARQAEIRQLRMEERVLAHRAIERGLRDADYQAAAKLGVTILRLHDVEIERVKIAGG